MPSGPAGTPRGCGLPEVAATLLERAGFTVAGVLDARDYDRLVPAAWRRDEWMPDARSALVLGTGGGVFEAAWRRALEARAVAARDPIDGFTRSVLQDFVGALRPGADACADADESDEAARPGSIARFHLYCDRRGGGAAGGFADFVALARACGLGAPSRLGLLLHPRFGPWWSVRAVVLTRLRLRPTRDEACAVFDPCGPCPAPCQVACPVAAVGASGFEASVCAEHRLASADCASRCDARRACPVGGAHAHAPEDEAFYAAASLRWIRSGPLRGRA